MAVLMERLSSRRTGQFRYGPPLARAFRVNGATRKVCYISIRDIGRTSPPTTPPIFTTHITVSQLRSMQTESGVDQERLKQLKHELKKYETAFKAKHGRAAERDEIRNDPATCMYIVHLNSGVG